MKIIILLLALCASVVYSQELTYNQKIVAMTILGEARGEGKPGQYAVACIIAQRAINGGKTHSQICLKNNGKVWQFSCWSPKDPNRAKLSKLLESPQADYAKTLAINITRLDHNFTGKADHYCHININPYWTYKVIRVKGKPIKVSIKPIKIIGQHKFYKLK
tara:strand:- start:165 stop:650 length:486 start_codon:yes stop_codon:yes gene_type:complete